MDWITTIANALTQLSIITKERLVVLVILSLFVFGFYSQYSTIQEQKLTLKEHEKNCSDLIYKIREDNRVSDSKRANLFQDQINEFILRKNRENDSIHTYFFNTIRKYNSKISSIDKELNNMSNENNN